MSDKIIIGIDPGEKGFVSVISPFGDYEFCSIVESSKGEVDKFIKKQVELSRDRSCGIIAVMEEVHALFGSSAKATFAFGKINGILESMLISNCVPYHLVQPKIWQKEIWITQDKIYKDTGRTGKDGKPIKAVDQKPTSINAARRLFPNVDFRRSSKCKNIDDNKCDSLLIAEYARRKNL